MGQINKQLQVIKNKFPAQNERIGKLFQMNEDFHTLCLDYFLCLRQMQKLERETDEQTLSIAEFSDLRKELENELKRFIFNG